MFNLAIDSKLRGCDVDLRVEDVAPHRRAVDRATVRQKKTGQPVRSRTKSTSEVPGQSRHPLPAGSRRVRAITGCAPPEVFHLDTGNLPARRYCELIAVDHHAYCRAIDLGNL